MYWPFGVPKVFAYHGPQRCPDGESSDLNGSTLDLHAVEVNDAESFAQASSTADDGRPTPKAPDECIIDVRTTRSDYIFATISRTTLQIWLNKPTVVLASLSRSSKSMEIYGENIAVFFRPDASVVVIRTSLSYLITYSLESDPAARALQQSLGYSQARRQSVLKNFGADDAVGVNEILLRFRRAIKVDAGINAVFAMDHELVVATTKPAAVQCVRWELEKGNSQATAQLISRMDWMEDKSPLAFMVQDRAMNLAVWLSESGAGYAVQRVKAMSGHQDSSGDSGRVRASSSPVVRLFDGYRFHVPTSMGDKAVLATINARFSLIAIATSDGQILCYSAKDYVGNIPLSHRFLVPISHAAVGQVTCLTWSPDGYCLFAGYRNGWASWSVFGKEGATSFHTSSEHAITNNEGWLLNVETANWTSGGAELLLSSRHDSRLWRLQFSRSAAVGCYSCANLSRALLQLPTGLALYCGHDLPDLNSISNDASLWHHTQYPASYLHNQWPIKSAAISPDGRYVAIAGKRGLAHYSLQSGRWKTFVDYEAESAFSVRGGMCWFHNILVVATERPGGYDLRLYPRDRELEHLPLQMEHFNTPVAFVGPSGEDSLLVYTYENVLYHYIVNMTLDGAQLLQVGQIAFQGIVRAPSRVRSVSWILPDAQLRNGDPARDVEHAAVMFLVDDKLVLLQPRTTPENSTKYDMRVIAQHVEYYIPMRDQMFFSLNDPVGESVPPTPSPGLYPVRSQMHFSLRDSLWAFTGKDLKMWTDVREIIDERVDEEGARKSTVLSLPTDFYPLSILLNKAVILGIESELLQRRDVSFAQYRTIIRSQLLLPYVLRYQLSTAGDTAAAFGLANQYQHLSYFPHALEILLHHVLDNEVDERSRHVPIRTTQMEPLPAVLSFLQMVLSPMTYLSTVVQCIRKTEVTSWRLLFAHLPPPLTLFEQSIELSDLKTASGWLLVLHGLEGEDSTTNSNGRDNDRLEAQITRLMVLAESKQDFELCAELARFMMGIDSSGHLLRGVVAKVGFRDKMKKGIRAKSSEVEARVNAPANNVMRRQPSRGHILQLDPVRSDEDEPADEVSQKARGGNPRAKRMRHVGDYFSTSPTLE